MSLARDEQACTGEYYIISGERVRFPEPGTIAHEIERKLSSSIQSVPAIPQMGWLRQQTFISYISGGWGFQAQCPCRFKCLVRICFLVHKALAPLLSSQGSKGKRAVWVSWREGKWSEVKLLSRVRLFATPWTAAHQAPPSMGFSRQEYWSGLPFPLMRGQIPLMRVPPSLPNPAPPSHLLIPSPWGLGFQHMSLEGMWTFTP